MDKTKLFFVIAMVIIVAIIIAVSQKDQIISVTNFEECIDAGNPAMESYPRQCRHNDRTYTEDISDKTKEVKPIYVSTPKPNDIITSPLTIKGKAIGTWFFEGDFPVMLTDWDGKIIAEGFAAAKGDWMTDEFVPFTTSLEFVNPEYRNNGTLILQKDNPSDLPELDDALEVSIYFEEQEDVGPKLPKDKAYKIADDSEECSMAGIAKEDHVYNEITKTWWIDLEREPELEKDGCNPACVVNEETLEAEVNWRCTGLIPEEEIE